MTQDAYWDELGLAWTAASPDIQVIVPRLKARMRRQSVAASVLVFAGLPVSLAGIALGLWTIWRGVSAEAWFFLTRGIAILTISLLAGFAAWSFKCALQDTSHSLAAMIGSALLRAQRWQAALRLGYFCCAIALLFGTLGYLLRIQMGKPSAMPLWPALILLPLLWLVLYLLQRKAADDIARYRYLKQLLSEEPR